MADSSLLRKQLSAHWVQMAAVCGILMTCFINDRRSLNLSLPSVTVNLFDRQMIGTLQKYWQMILVILQVRLRFGHFPCDRETIMMLRALNTNVNNATSAVPAEVM